MAENWYVVFCRPGQDARAEQNLCRQQVRTYRPKRVNNAGEFTSLFPRYLFISLDLARQSVRAVNNTRGVCSMVSFGGTLATLRNECISMIQKAEKAVRFEAKERFAVGDRVEFGEGPLEYYEGVVRARSSRDRVVVLVEMMGAERLALVSETRLARV
jgi:transcriptional antiterminator RfaH